MVSQFAKRLSIIVHSSLASKMQIKSVALLLLGAGLWYLLNFSFIQVLLAVFIVYTITGGWHFLKVIYKTFPRDMRAGLFLLKAKRLNAKYTREKENVPSLFQKVVKAHPNKVAFILVDGPQYTFQDVEDLSNQVANYFLQSGYKRGDVVAIFMESSPQFICLWLGLAKIGVVPALINFNLRMDPLAHCIKIANAKALIYSTQYATAVKEVESMIPATLQMFGYGDNSSEVIMGDHLNQLIAAQSKISPPKNTNMGFNDKLFYIYTSGTTGLPKAAVVINSRFHYMASSVNYFHKLTPDDILYEPLPLYHSGGGVVGVGQALLKGCTVVIRNKFSASRFWDDCVKYNCTACQYIGEICRYLLAQPHKPVDSQNRVRVAFGNGLRPQIWREFKERFRIERIGEFYGATEGNANMTNTDNTEGAVGFTTMIAPALYPIKLIKVDEATGRLLRDRNGMCITAAPNEPGELVGKIIKGDSFREFDGYVNKDATDKKIARDVFTKGDTAFLTGDILVMDEYGYFYFRDRTGDTFRWKAENVSTFEVEAQISKILHVDVAVYGVEIPGTDGRAGMAAIAKMDVDLKELYTQQQKLLPSYARPIFLRLLEKVDLTGTLKIRKVDHQKDGFNPGATTDRLYYLDSKKGGYQPLDKQVYEDILQGKLKF